MDIGLELWEMITLWGAALPPWIQITWNIILVVLGVNALIIVHEFGHFIVARMCGVRCDKFYIWFDVGGWRFFRFRWGDTEYGLGVLPLGGYVKMFGQEDNPGQIAKEIEKARIAAEQAQNENAEKKPEDSENREPAYTGEELRQMKNALYAKDSYLSKSVPQRMAIISAGVIMNLIFAFLCASGAYMLGFWEMPCAVGSVVPGSPAWKAGLKVGDRILKVDETKEIKLFSQLMDAILDSKNPDGVKLTIERPGEGLLERTVVPSKVDGALVPSIGIGSLFTPRLNEKSAVSESAEKLLPDKIISQIHPGDRLVAIDGEPVAHYADITQIQIRKSDQPLEYRFQRNPGKSGSKIENRTEKSPNPNGEETSPGPENVDSSSENSVVEKGGSENEYTVSLPAIPMKHIGVRFRMGEIIAIRKGSPAEQQGIEPGDVLVDVDQWGTFDPLKLPQYLERKAESGATEVAITLRKKKKDAPSTPVKSSTENSETDAVAEDEVPPGSEFGERKFPEGDLVHLNLPLEKVFLQSFSLPNNEGIACSTLGIAYKLENRVEGVESWVETSGKNVPIGGTVEKIEFPDFIVPGLSKTSFIEFRSKWYFKKVGFRFTHIGERIQIPFIFEEILPFAPEKTKVVLHVSHKNKTETYEFEIRNSEDWFFPDRGLNFEPERFFTQSKSLSEAARLGFGKTVDGTLAVYRFLSNIGRKVSAKAMGGPITIVKFAYNITADGLAPFLLFLCLIGANLAVLNILPIPVLDGGHLVFLAYEAIFRKPPNEAIQIALSYLGLFLLLGLMIWAISLDLGFISRS